ncbi:hypothetical protein A2442_03810 [Candidatus Campbellbacteria bacterium RIFOXYC2_FULL_35_25]|uniref:Uncharacterized protein n=1 Tax=Candidatus Campbellbacteria bacterium RIFOXYC2_FULL_35_25 TaxID=1797582 RepID=A0A1F5EK18_9BACT|nr:MAG: hypothetical protein A2442_03810 [Candidatus Campbellbacteria bacterium RIFOXYC2_FULL_35_25]
MKKGFGLIGILIVLGFIAVVGGGGYFYLNNRTTHLLHFDKTVSNLEISCQKDDDCELVSLASGCGGLTSINRLNNQDDIEKFNKKEEALLSTVVFDCDLPMEKYNYKAICDSGVCSIKENEIVNWGTYINEEFGFEVKYPKDFNLNITKDLPIKITISNQIKPSANDYLGGREELNITIFDDNNNYSDYYQSYMEWVNRDFNEPFLSGYNNKKILDINGYKFVSFEVVSGMDEVREYILKGDNKTFVLSTSVVGKDSNDTKLQEIISTFRFLE